MKFDWYQATIEAPPNWLAGALQEHFQGVWEDTKPRNGYDECRNLKRCPRACNTWAENSDETILQLMTGSRYEHPHVLSSGQNAPDVAELLRGMPFRHAVTRADAAEDLQAPGWFEQALDTCLEVALKEKVRPYRAGDWDSDCKARTLYVGSPSSSIRLRLYEKGIEMRERHKVEAPTDWIRIEVQLRPSDKVLKQVVSRSTPEEVFACTRWTKQIAGRLLSIEAPRMSLGTRYRLDDLERSEYFLFKQYGGILLKLAEKYGGGDALIQRAREFLESPAR